MRKPTKLIMQIVGNTLILGGVALLTLTTWPTVSSEMWYWGKKIERLAKCKLYRINCQTAADPESLFAPLANSPTPLKVEPVSEDFNLIIEKIGVNAPIVPNVSAAIKGEYMEAMERGIAHAKGTAKPGENGNLYLFAHSSLNFWQLGPYATVFNLLRKLESGDKVTVIYQNKRFDYTVREKKIYPGFDTTPLLKRFEEPTLTLQTCHPPGTTLNRLIVTAKLIEN